MGRERMMVKMVRMTRMVKMLNFLVVVVMAAAANSNLVGVPFSQAMACAVSASTKWSCKGPMTKLSIVTEIVNDCCLFNWILSTKSLC